MEHSGFFDFEVKSMTEAGVFTGYASTFGNEDLQGDVVMPGAFKRTLGEIRARGGTIPILMAHNSGRPIGFGIAASEDRKGLAVTGELTIGSDEGRNAYALLKHAAKVGHAFGLSIGYGIAAGGATVDAKNGVRRLNDLDLYEYSLAATPANTEARVQGVKSRDRVTSLLELVDSLRAAGFAAEAAKLFRPGI